MFPVGQAHIIRDPSKGRESERQIMDGVIHSGVMTDFQQRALDGIIRSGMTAQEQKEHKADKGAKGRKPITHKVKAPATHFDPGFVKYPGSKY